MIFDFGCQTSPEWTSLLVPVLRGVLASLALIAGLASLGRFFRKGPSSPAYDVLCGWSLVAALLTITCVIFAHPLMPAMIALGGATLFAIFIAARRGYFKNSFWIFVLIVASPLLLAINFTGIGKWDDFSHWVPNALYLFQNNGVPGSALPTPTSVWPGYPYALPFLTYLASHLAGGFLVAGGTMINLLLLCCFAGLLAKLRRSHEMKASWVSDLGWLGFALLSVTLLNPSFNASFTMTSQGDTPTMVCVGALGILFWNLIPALRQQDQTIRRDLFIQILSISVLLVLIKQVDVALLGLLLIGFFVASWKNGVGTKAAIMVAPIFIVALIFRYTWQHHVDMQIAGNGFSLKPIHEWRWDLVGPLLIAMKDEAIKKNGCFVLVLITSITALTGLFRKPQRLNDFAIIAGTVSGGYVVFLAICYSGATFSEMEIRRAASFYRYTSQIGLLNLTFIWIALPQIIDWVKRKHSLPLVSDNQNVKNAFYLFSIVVLPLSLAINPSLLLAVPGAHICQLRDEAKKITASLAEGSRLAIIDPEGDSLFTYITKFEIALEGRTDEKAPTIVLDINALNVDTFKPRLQNLENEDDLDAIYLGPSNKYSTIIAGYSNNDGPLLLLHERGIWKRSPL